MLNREQLEELREFDTPTVSNAIERFDIRPRNEGFMSQQIQCIIPYEKPVIGYACTGKFSASQPPTEVQKELTMKYYETVKNAPAYAISVIQDLDSEPIGSFWGEVQTSIHKALGAVGVVTNGGVRDLDEVKELEFGYFASCVLVSHAYGHLEDYDCEVEVGGLTIRPGDLLHADKHGVVLIPGEIADQLAEACRKAQAAEEPVISGCQQHFTNGDVDLNDLSNWRKEMARLRASK